MFLLGLTWTFGLLYLNESTVAMAYVFTILNSFQGVFIFFFHCFQNEQVRKDVYKALHRHGCLPSSCLAANSSSSNTSGTSPSAGGKDNQTIFYGSSGTGPNSAGATLTASDALTTATVSYYFDDVETTTVGTIIDLCITVHAPAVERPRRRDSGCTSTQQQQQQHATQQHQEQPIAIQRQNSQTAADDQLTSRTGGKQLTFATLVWLERVH